MTSPEAPPTDPRLDTAHWQVFGRAFPRRFSFYFRIVAFLLLVGFLALWFTRDVTYISNVKVSGLDHTEVTLRAPLRTLSEDFAALINQLADHGYAWQSGGLPAMRTAGALSVDEAARAFALGTLAVRRGGDSLLAGTTAATLGTFLAGRGWQPAGGGGGLQGATKTVDGLQGRFTVEQRSDGRQLVELLVTRR
ncbi:MAG: hypothetical protein M1337_05890 [Actinobacteria bacterium]|nr:hypothetical protein [Actinomycetota bacterium]